MERESTIPLLAYLRSAGADRADLCHREPGAGRVGNALIGQLDTNPCMTGRECADNLPGAAIACLIDDEDANVRPAPSRTANCAAVAAESAGSPFGCRPPAHTGCIASPARTTTPPMALVVGVRVSAQRDRHERAVTAIRAQPPRATVYHEDVRPVPLTTPRCRGASLPPTAVNRHRLAGGFTPSGRLIATGTTVDSRQLAAHPRGNTVARAAGRADGCHGTFVAIPLSGDAHAYDQSQSRCGGSRPARQCTSVSWRSTFRTGSRPTLRQPPPQFAVLDGAAGRSRPSSSMRHAIAAPGRLSDITRPVIQGLVSS